MARKKKEPDKLAQEVAQALACGMSYGKWKAMQDPVKIEKKIPEGWKACAWCGKPFKPKTQKQKYCELSCQRAANKERERQRRNEYMKERREKMKEGVC
ncbi:MAG: hypothetical protein IJO04_05105 [Oscillospiraceae bacterium]|nr:hypothetical protein [Oscillospiraceae bacterium]